MIDEYLEFCRQHRGLAAQTIRFRGAQLRALESFLRGRGVPELSGVSLDHLDAFLDERGKTLSRTSLACLVSVLRGFLRYLYLLGEELEDRSDWLEAPTLFAQMRLPRHLEDSQVEMAFARVNLSTISGVRDCAALMLLYYYGWRAGEVTGLQLDDVDFECHRLQLLRLKGGGRQFFPLLEPVERALKAYLKVRPTSALSPVFLTVRRPYRALRPAVLSGRVCNYLEGVPGVGGAHAFRHTLARRLRQGGAPMPVISRLLGHGNPDSTATYIRIATDELAEVADNYAELLL